MTVWTTTRLGVGIADKYFPTIGRSEQGSDVGCSVTHTVQFSKHFDHIVALLRLNPHPPLHFVVLQVSHMTSQSISEDTTERSMTDQSKQRQTKKPSRSLRTSTQGRRKLRSKDILCTKGSFGESHPGNARYWKILQSFHQEYMNCEQRSDKFRIILEVIATVKRYGGRFVRYDSESGLWEELSIAMEREKVSHGLRWMDTRRSFPPKQSSVEKEEKKRAFQPLRHLEPEIKVDSGDVLLKGASSRGYSASKGLLSVIDVINA